MYFCDPCAKQNNWPTSFARSYGTCEVCKRLGSCHDVPSKDLPKREPVPQPSPMLKSVNVSTQRWEAAADNATKAGHRPAHHW